MGKFGFVSNCWVCRVNSTDPRPHLISGAGNGVVGTPMPCRLLMIIRMGSGKTVAAGRVGWGNREIDYGYERMVRLTVL